MSTVCTICARGGSQGVPGKNIRLLAGRPLIVHTIELALAQERIDSVHVSTDSPEIARIAREAGADVPFLRPPELATASAGKLSAIIHLIEYLEANGAAISTIVDLDPTSPLRSAEDIDACLDLVERRDAAAVITGYPAPKNPYFNMVELDADGIARLCKRVDAGAVLSRQAAPPVYAMNASIYVWRRDALKKDLWSSEPRLHIMPHERSVDIDSEMDFKLVELLMAERQSP
jgi:CMP-N-acetylneuraminic acid synthetase